MALGRCRSASEVVGWPWECVGWTQEDYGWPQEGVTWPLEDFGWPREGVRCSKKYYTYGSEAFNQPPRRTSELAV